jgi:hypothetical protein
MNKGTHEYASLKGDLADRLARVRRELYGEHGGPELARALGLPYRTWADYEAGVSIPGEVLLAFIEATGAEPAWLLRGRGPTYRGGPPAG